MTDDRKPSWEDVAAVLRDLEAMTATPPRTEPIKLTPWQWEVLKAMYPPQGPGPYDLGGQLGPRYDGIPIVVEDPPKPGWVRRLWWRLTDPVRARWTGRRMRRRGVLLDEVNPPVLGAGRRPDGRRP